MRCFPRFRVIFSSSKNQKRTSKEEERQPNPLTFEQGLHRPKKGDLRVRGDRRCGVLELPGEGPLGRRRRRARGGGSGGRRASGDGSGGGLLLLAKVLGPGRGDDEATDGQNRGSGVEGGGRAQGEGLDEDVGEEAGCFFRLFLFSR